MYYYYLACFFLFIQKSVINIELFFKKIGIHLEDLKVFSSSLIVYLAIDYTAIGAPFKFLLILVNVVYVLIRAIDVVYNLITKYKDRNNKKDDKKES